MFKRANRYFALLLGLLFCTPGCITYYKLSEKEFPQGNPLARPHKLIQQFLRTVKIYDQFHTQAIFDTLWLSDAVRTDFAQRYTTKRGKDEETVKAFTNRQLEENRHWITFYVLADVRDGSQMVLSDKNSIWTLYLEIDGKTKVEPISLKEVELEPEYNAFFGNRVTLFKNIYLVKFPAYDDMENKFYLKGANHMRLIISSPTRQSHAEWDIQSSGIMKKTAHAIEVREKEPYVGFDWV